MGTNPAAKYTDEFRREIADYIISSGRSITECCRELREARRRIRGLETENAFLKKPRPSSPKTRRGRTLPPDGGGEEGPLPRQAQI